MSILICYIPNVVAYFMLIAEIISNLYTCIAFPLILSITMIFELILPLIRIYSEGHLKQALKYRLNMWTLACFYYLYIGTYCCVFIKLLQVRIAAVHNSNICDLSLKVNALSCWKYALHQTQA